MATSEDVKILVVESGAPESPRASATPKTPGSQLSPKSRIKSPFMPTIGMDPRDVDFWPPQRYDKDSVDFSRPPQEWDTSLLLKQVVEHKRPYPLDSVTFREYLTGFYTEENIDFLLELSRLRRQIESDKNPRVKELIEFYEKYMKASGAKSANISSAALDHVEGILNSGERELEIRDFHLANRDIADLLIRGPYLRDFFRTNLSNERESYGEHIASRITCVVCFFATLVILFLTLKYTYWYLFLGLYFTWLFWFQVGKIITGICPLLCLYHGGYRLRPTAQFWHCFYMNEHLQKVHDQDVLDAQRKSSKMQTVLVLLLTGVVLGAFALIRYFVIDN